MKKLENTAADLRAELQESKMKSTTLDFELEDDDMLKHVSGLPNGGTFRALLITCHRKQDV